MPPTLFWIFLCLSSLLLPCVADAFLGGFFLQMQALVIFVCLGVRGSVSSSSSTCSSLGVRLLGAQGVH